MLTLYFRLFTGLVTEYVEPGLALESVVDWVSGLVTLCRLAIRTVDRSLWWTGRHFARLTGGVMVSVVCGEFWISRSSLLRVVCKCASPVHLTPTLRTLCPHLVPHYAALCSITVGLTVTTGPLHSLCHPLPHPLSPLCAPL